MTTFRGMSGHMALGGYLLGTPLVDGAVAPGAQTMSLYGAPLAGVSGPGDRFTINGDTYTITSAFQSSLGNSLTALTFTPGAIGAGFADNAPIFYLTNTIIQIRNWSLTPSLAVLDTSAQQQRWRTGRSGLAMWTGRFEALLDLTDPQQAELMTHLTGATPDSTSVALFFGVQAGEAQGFFGMALISSDTIPNPLRDIVTLTIDCASDGFVARHWEEVAACVAIPPALATSLLACLDMEETTGTRFDSVGLNHVDPLNGVARRPALRGGFAAHFEATSFQSLEGGSTGLQFNGAPFSLAFWARPRAFTGATQVLISLGRSLTVGQYTWYIALLPDGHLAVRFGAGFAGQIASSTAVLTAGNEYFVMVWHDGVTLSLQVNNGAIDTHTPGVVTFVSGDSVVFNYGAIGHQTSEDHAAARQFFNGDMSSVMSFNVALTNQADRNILWRDGAGVRCECP